MFRWHHDLEYRLPSQLVSGFVRTLTFTDRDATLRFHSGGESDDDDDSPSPELPDWKSPTRKQILNKLMEHEMPKCTSDYDKVDDKGKLWYDSGAEQWVDKYISQLDDHSQWAQTLLYDLFKNVEDKEVKKEDFSCDAPGSKCSLARTCGKFTLSPS